MAKVSGESSPFLPPDSASLNEMELSTNSGTICL